MVNYHECQQDNGVFLGKLNSRKLGKLIKAYSNLNQVKDDYAKRSKSVRTLGCKSI